MTFTSKRLNYFITVAQEGTITRAAEKLCITPSPLSKRIKELENELNIKLFHRQKSGLILTKDGESLYKNVIALHSSINNLKKTRRKRTIVIGVLGPYSAHIDTSIHWINSQFSGCHVELEHNNEYIAEKFCHYDMVFSTKKLNAPYVTPFLCSKEKMKLAHISRLPAECCTSLPFIQSSYFVTTEDWKNTHFQLVAQGFSPEVMIIDNQRLRFDIARAGHGIGVVIESVRYQEKNIDEFAFCALNIDNDYVTNNIYITNTTLFDTSEFKRFLLDNSDLTWV